MDGRDDTPQPDEPKPSSIPTSRRAPEPPPPTLEELGSAPAAAALNAPYTDELEAEPLPDWLAPFQNRLIIAGLSVLALLALTAVVLFVFSRGTGTSVTANVGVIATDENGTPRPNTNLMAEALETTTLFNGPSTTFAPLGTVPRGARVAIVGRNEDNTWLQVTYPPGSPLRGWVSSDFFSFSGSLEGIQIAGPGQGPNIEVPTSPPVFIEDPIVPQPPVFDPTDTPVPAPTNTPRAPATNTPVAATNTPVAQPTDTPAAPTEPPGDTAAPNPTITGGGE